MSEEADKKSEFQLLTGETDLYSGVRVDSTLLAETTDLFEKQLEESLKVWRSAKRRGIWLSIPVNRTVLIPVAQKFGFSLHHAREDYVMMTCWLDENEPNQLPKYAISSIGVGGLVVNKKREVLLVQERFAHIEDYFKLPGGALDLGESIENGVAREVFEETGIRAKFQGVLAFTYKEKFRFGHSDIYIVCLMSLPEDEQEQQIHFDPMEIANCKWMSLDLWANSPELHRFRITLNLARSAVAVLDGRDTLLEPERYEIKITTPKEHIWDVMMYQRKTE